MLKRTGHRHKMAKKEVKKLERAIDEPNPSSNASHTGKAASKENNNYHSNNENDNLKKKNDVLNDPKIAKCQWE
jgi:hypothetical protein